ncbi:hypothetical protein VIBNISOn1_1050001 [Vibrio nigripulchritudo SOn1]|uniref:Uncharacterized protein n=1 Tax=Vibrio nigripulchritudo SOn1 TaxID=1238450 RepID=A0AAV2VHQ4_9VIBR|nr:hypothetical protein [Vibrio nigripulchritudo]CCO44175.1 hypothetical protein VIBNISOn1_1050001 [Vibrio nigripulchritudo SOn1]
MNKWMSSEYISTMSRLADIYKDSKLTNIQFRGDVGTVYALLCKADAWGINPDYMLGQSYIDNFGRIDHTGSIYRLALANANEVDKVTIEQCGDWDKVKGQFSVVTSDQHRDERLYRKLWSDDIERELSVTITVKFIDPHRNTVKSCRTLCSVDDSIKGLDHTWITSPRKRLESMIVRDLCHNELYDLVHGINAEDAEAEMGGYMGQFAAAASPTLNTIPNTTTTECVTQSLREEASTPDTSVKADNHKDTGQRDLLDRAMSIQDKAIKAQIDNDSESLTAQKKHLVALTEEALNNTALSNGVKDKLKKIYEETATIVIDDGTSILEDI